MPSCTAVNCTNRDTRKNRRSGLTFHRFPHCNAHLLKQWVLNMRRDRWIPTARSHLCSNHFTNESFDRTGQTVRLRQNAVPTIFNFPGHLQKTSKCRKPPKVRTPVSQEPDVSPSSSTDPNPLTPDHPDTFIDHSYAITDPPRKLKRRLDEAVGTKCNDPSPSDYLPPDSKGKRRTGRLKGTNEGVTATLTSEVKLGGNSSATPSVLYVSVLHAQRTEGNQGVSSDNPTNPAYVPHLRMGYDEEQALENSLKKKARSVLQKVRSRRREVVEKPEGSSTALLEEEDCSQVETFGFGPLETEKLETESPETAESSGEEINPDYVPSMLPTTSKSTATLETKISRFNSQSRWVNRKGKKDNNPSSPDYFSSVSKGKRHMKRLKGTNEGVTATKKSKVELCGNLSATPSVLYVSVPRTQGSEGNQVTSSVHSDIVEVVIYEDDCGAEAQTCTDKNSVSTTVQMLLSENQQLRDMMSAVDLSEVSFRDNDEKTKVYTGLTTFTLLMAVFDLIRPNLEEKPNEALTPFQQLLLTLMKLRLGIPLQYLSYAFKVQDATVQRTFSDVIHILNVKFVPLILFWPEREQIRRTMPYVFKAAFPKCASIIDCFEVLIEKPAASHAKSLQHPHDKSHNSMKYLISVTPQGFVSFVSQGWAGCTSNRLLTERCGYLRNLEAGDTVLAHRDFSIEDVVAIHGAELQIPDFTETKGLSYREILETRHKASVRKHIERMIGNVRQNYPILQSTVPIDFLQTNQSGLMMVDKIVRVACGLCNICESVVPFD